MSAHQQFSNTDSIHNLESKYKLIHPLLCRLNGAGLLLDYNLPAITICGNQGSGKTRLIEAISGINLPCFQQTSTRCPVELMFLSGSIELSCSVSVYIWHDDIYNVPVKAAKELYFQKDIKEPALIALAVRCAQKALLNPGQDIQVYKSYLDNDGTDFEFEDENDQLCYTRNSIIVRVFGSKQKLTLIDLPGSGDSTDLPKEQVDFTEKLIAHYIRRPYMLILATVSCLDAIKPLRIFSLISQFDPKGHRTICVLTKPDIIGQEKTDAWFRALRDQFFQPELGFHIVKNPDDLELKTVINHQKARNSEIDFFFNNQPWSLSNSTMRSHLGVDNLRDLIYSHIDLMTIASLPDLQSKIDNSLNFFKKELASLPISSFQNPNSVLIEAIKNFFEKLKNTLKKNSDSFIFRHIDSCYQELNQTLNGHRPVLLLPTIYNSKNSDSPPQSPEVKRYLDEESLEYYVHFDKAENATWFTPERLLMISNSLKENNRFQTSDEELTKYILKECQSDWTLASQVCLNKVTSAFKKMIKQLINYYFGQYKILPNHINVFFEGVIQENYQKASKKIVEIASTEEETIATWDASLDKLIKKINLLLDTPLSEQSTRIFQSGTDPFLNQFAELLSEYNLPITYPDTSRSASDLNDAILIGLVNAQAYYCIAKKRFGDYVPLIISQVFICQLISSSETRLINFLSLLKINTQEFDVFLEDEQIVSRRDSLKSSINKLEQLKRSMLS